MLDDIRIRVRKLFSSKNVPTEAQARSSRERRHDLVAGLQQDVRRLQQEISDLNDLEQAEGGELSRPDSERMAALHGELSRKQAELARYQARI